MKGNENDDEDDEEKKNVSDRTNENEKVSDRTKWNQTKPTTLTLAHLNRWEIERTDTHELQILTHWRN